MSTKPVTPAMHGIIDYVFSGIQLAAPMLLPQNKKAGTTYRMLGAGFLAVNLLTDTPYGLKKVISFRGHQKADAGFLAGLALLTCAAFIRHDKKALAFHLGFLGIALTHYVLTDYAAGSQEKA